MTKKHPEKIKGAAGKLKNQKDNNKNARVLQMNVPASPTTKSVTSDPGYAQALQNYQDGLRALQERRFDRAKLLFNKVLSSEIRELMDRSGVHLNTCNQYLERANTNFKSVEEHYDYAISQMNLGEYVGAREHLEKLVKQAPKADFIWYGLAVLNCLTGHVEDSLKQLNEAINLNAANRFQARNDSDFRNLADDPRFTELLYPESGTPEAYPPGGSPYRH